MNIEGSWPRLGACIRAVIFGYVLGSAALCVAQPALPGPFVESPTSVPEAESVLERAVRAVGQIRVETASRQVFATGTMFFVRNDGLAITNFHVLDNSATGHVLCFESETALPYSVLRVDAELDIAVIQVDLSDLDVRGEKRPHAMDIAASEPRMGSDVWAIGYPKGLSTSITRGVVSAVRSRDALPEKTRAGRRADSRWVQTDCVVNPGNSGGPLVNADGEVVGINTWVWLKADAMYFALSAGHLRELLTDIPDTPMPQSQLTQLYSGPRQSISTFPSLDVPHTCHPKELRRAAVGFAAALECRTCDGDGKVTATKIKRTKMGSGRSMRSEESIPIPCKSCDGTGYADLVKIEPATGKLVRAIAAIDTNSAGSLEAIDAVIAGLSKLRTSHPDQFDACVNAWWSRVLGAANIPAATPGMVVGRLTTDMTFGNGTERVRIVHVEGTSVSIVLTNIVGGNAIEGQRVIATGLFAGFLEGEDGMSMPVLQNGLIVRAD